VGELDGLDDRLVEWAAALLREARAPVVITRTRSSHRFQRSLYARAQLGGNPFPVAPPGRSAHQVGLAWDMVGPLPELRRLGALWRRWGGVWGGAVDPIHFEGTARLLNSAPGTGHRTK